MSEEEGHMVLLLWLKSTNIRIYSSKWYKLYTNRIAYDYRSSVCCLYAVIWRIHIVFLAVAFGLQHQAISASANMANKYDYEIEENADPVVVHSALLGYVHYLLHYHDDEYVKKFIISRFSQVSIYEANRDYGNAAANWANSSTGKIRQADQERKHTLLILLMLSRIWMITLKVNLRCT